MMKQPDFDSVRILVAGDVMLDRYWFGDVSRISPEAPVPVVRVERHEERLGGAANVARNTAALGARTALLGVVGQDEGGNALERLLGEASIDSHLKRDPSYATIVKLRVIGRQQQLLRIDFEASPARDVLSDKLSRFKALLSEFDIIVLSDYAKGGMTDVTEMIAAAKAAGKAVLVDPKGEDFTRYSGATVLTPNKAELRAVVGSWKSEDELTHKAQQLRERLDIQALLLTRSEEGMSLFTPDGVSHMPADAREVYDVSGAGDTVIATMATMLGAGATLADAASMANRAGGIVVGKLGTATVTRAELYGG